MKALLSSILVILLGCSISEKSSNVNYYPVHLIDLESFQNMVISRRNQYWIVEYKESSKLYRIVVDSTTSKDKQTFKIVNELSTPKQGAIYNDSSFQKKLFACIKTFNLNDLLYVDGVNATLKTPYVLAYYNKRDVLVYKPDTLNELEFLDCFPKQKLQKLNQNYFHVRAKGWLKYTK